MTLQSGSTVESEGKKMTWTQYADRRPSLGSMEKALKAAGIDPDCSKWSEADVQRAEEVLAKAAGASRGAGYRMGGRFQG